MKKQVKEIIFRYSILVILALIGLSPFYKILTPLTVYPVFFALKILYNAKLILPNIIEFDNFTAEIIPACVAGAAYFLLVALNLTTPMKLNKRLHSLSFLISSLLILNIARIIIFASLVVVGFQYFDLAHKIFWYFGSTILLVVIWFVNVIIFKIPSIPVYTDVRTILKHVK